MLPFCLTTIRLCLSAAALEARGTNVLRSQLQIAQSANKPATSLAASLERLVWVEKARRLLRHCRHRINRVPDDRPDGDLKPLLAVGTGLPCKRCLNRHDAAPAIRTGSSPWHFRRHTAHGNPRESEQIDTQARTRLCLYTTLVSQTRSSRARFWSSTPAIIAVVISRIQLTRGMAEITMLYMK